MSSHTGSGVGLGVGTGVGVGVGVGLGVGVGSGVTVVEASEDGGASLELVSPEQPLRNSSVAHKSRARIFLHMVFPSKMIRHYGYAICVARQY